MGKKSEYTQAMVLHENALMIEESTTLLRIIETFCLAELSQMQEKLEKPWMDNEQLNKRRSSYEFDREIQSLFNCIGTYGDFQAHVIKCGNSGLCRTELSNKQGVSLHFFNYFHKESKYLFPYLEKNNVINAPRYAFFEYKIHDGRIIDLKFVIPFKNNYVIHDVIEYYKNVRSSINGQNINFLLERLKENKSISTYRPVALIES